MPAFITVEFFAILMFFISLYGLIVSKNIIKSMAFLMVMETAVIMFFLSIGYSAGILPPIGENLAYIDHVSDPFPQALMITAIVIGLSVTAINIIMFITMFRKYKTADWDTLRQKSMETK